jgi:hypothetical protein
MQWLGDLLKEWVLWYPFVPGQLKPDNTHHPIIIPTNWNLEEFRRN